MKNISDCFVLNNGVKIPCVGYGTWRTPDGIDTVKAVRKRLTADTGILIQPSFMEMKKVSERVSGNPALTEASCLSPRS